MTAPRKLPGRSSVAGSGTGRRGRRRRTAAIAAAALLASLLGPVLAGPAAALDVVTPRRTITGPATGLSTGAGPYGVAVDDTGRAFVASGAAVRVFTPGATGDAAPERVIVGAATTLSNPFGITLDRTGADLYVADITSGSIAVFRSGDSGNVAPQRRITGLTLPRDVAVDDAGHAYVYDIGASAVRVFDDGASGAATPLRSIVGSSTALASCSSLAVDGVGTVYVACETSHTIRVFAAGASGNVAPLRTISWPATGTETFGPYSIDVDPTGTTLAVGGYGWIATYPADASGDAAPTRYLTGAGVGQVYGIDTDAAGDLTVASHTGAVIEFGPPPVLASVTPDGGPAAGGTALTLVGRGFEPGAEVFLGASRAVGVVVADGTRITASTPPLAGGTYSVTVANPDHQTSRLAEAFVVESEEPAPTGLTVTSISPSSGSEDGGTVVTITGTGFDEASWAQFGERDAVPVDYPQGGSFQVVAPPGTAGPVDVLVGNGYDEVVTVPAGFTYLSEADPGGPTVRLIRPRSVVGLATSADVEWTGDATSGRVRSYRLQTASKPIDGPLGPFEDLGEPRTGTTAELTRLRPGTSTCVRVRATDTRDRDSEWSRTGCVTVPVDDRAMGSGAGWSRVRAPGAYRGTVTTSRVRRDPLTLPASLGSSLAVVVTRRPGGGVLGVFLDGRRVATARTSARRTVRAAVVRVPVRTTGQPVELRVLRPGRAGVSVDGIASLP